MCLHFTNIIVESHVSVILNKMGISAKKKLLTAIINNVCGCNEDKTHARLRTLQGDSEEH